MIRAFIVLKRALRRTYDDLWTDHIFAFAAALSYYFVLSLFPLLVFGSAVVAYLPVPNLFEQILGAMSRLVPPDGMGVVRRVVEDVVTPSRGAFLSLGLLGTLWAASGGFAAMIDALNVAYDVPETRPFWKTRPLALGLALLVGALLVVALTSMVLGPRFGEWLAAKLYLAPVWAWAWPYLRWTSAIAFTVLAVETIYFLGPNVKQRFRNTLVGALFAVGGWIGVSYLLGIYFQNFAQYNRTYGTLGAAIALMVWFYWSGLAILLGAEINSELIKSAREPRLEMKEPPERAEAA